MYEEINYISIDKFYSLCSMYLEIWSFHFLQFAQSFERVRDYVTIKWWQDLSSHFDKLFEDKTNRNNKLCIKMLYLELYCWTNFFLIYTIMFYYDQYLLRNHLWIGESYWIKYIIFKGREFSTIDYLHHLTVENIGSYNYIATLKIDCINRLIRLIEYRLENGIHFKH